MSITTTIISCTLLLCIFMHSFSSHVHAAPSASSDALCDLTPHPEFCRSQEPQNKSTNINDYGRLSIQKSLSISIVLLNTINRYLNSGHALSKIITFALQDCQFLLSSNVEMLSEIADILKSADSLQGPRYEDCETQLSAIITNKGTCMDGLATVPSASSIANDLSPALSNGTMLCSISLALFKKGWISPMTYKPRSLRELFPFSSTRRKLLQISGVNITRKVIVNPNGTGDYTNISAAIAAAPNNTKAGQGYYQIQVVAGVYEEYISIPSNKKYLMIVGAGINQTIITGNNSVGGGSTTFNSATFGTKQHYLYFIIIFTFFHH